MTRDTHLEHQQIYRGICAVAARCDGAQTLDAQGFDGQDTHFGRRIAAVPFEAWTDDVKAEAARLAWKYQTQILNYTGIDVTTLEAAKAAKEATTNHVARDKARQYEKQAEAEKNRVALANRRKAVVLPGNQLQLTWDRKDPDCFGVLLTEVKQLPGRRWDGSANIVDFSQAALDFIERHHLAHDFSLGSLKGAVEAKELQLRAAAKAEQERVKALLEAPQVTLVGKDRVSIKAPYNADLVAAQRSLPGRRYIGGDENQADLHPAVLELAEKFNLRVAPEVREALEGVQEAHEAVRSVENLLLEVSRMDDPAKLPEAFLAAVRERLT